MGYKDWKLRLKGLWVWCRSGWMVKVLERLCTASWNCVGSGGR